MNSTELVASQDRRSVPTAIDYRAAGGLNLKRRIIMHSRKFEPVESGQTASAPQHRGGTSKNEERRQAGTPATLEGNIDNAIDATDDTGKRLQRQAYPIRLLKQRYGLSHNYASFVTAEFGWGGPR